MTNTEHDNGGAKEKPSWIKEIDEAFTRTGDAIRSAWEATGDKRASTLESAKLASKELGEMIEEGIAAARERWAEERHASPEETDAAADVVSEEE